MEAWKREAETILTKAVLMGTCSSSTIRKYTKKTYKTQSITQNTFSNVCWKKKKNNTLTSACRAAIARSMTAIQEHVSSPDRKGKEYSSSRSCTPR